MASQTPRISCVIPAYEHLDQLARCLMSAVTQDCADLDILVTDDSHTDTIRRFTETVAGWAPHVRWIAGPRSGNPVDNWNHGLNATRGRYAAVVHQDEFYVDPTFLRRATAHLEQTQDDVVFGALQTIDMDRRSNFDTARRLASALHWQPWTLYAVNWLGPTAAMVFRNCAERRFDPRLTYLVDVDFIAQALGPGGRPIILAGPAVAGLAHHGTQITAAIDRHLLSWQEMTDVVARRPHLTASQITWLRRLAHLRLRLSRRHAAPQ